VYSYKIYILYSMLIYYSNSKTGCVCAYYRGYLPKWPLWLSRFCLVLQSTYSPQFFTNKIECEAQEQEWRQEEQEGGCWRERQREREREKSWSSTHLKNKREQLGCVAITTNSAGHLLACVCVCVCV